MAKVLIYGATGGQGEAVARELLAAGESVKVLLRNDKDSGKFKKLGAEIAYGDFDGESSLVEASRGVDKVSLVLPLNFDTDEFFTYGKNAVDAARKAGVELIVYNASLTTPNDESISRPFFETIRRIESYVLSSGLKAIVLRPSLYLDNFLAPWTLPLIYERKIIAYPLAEHLRLRWTSHKNLAIFTAAALQRPDLAGKILDVVDEKDLSGAEIAGLISQKVGAEIKYVGVSPQEFGDRLKPVLGERAAEELTTLYKFINQDDGKMLRKNYDESRRLLNVNLESASEWANRAFAPQKASKDL
ncbi:MAG: hypothetical protein AVDCRST_MAG74-213 [uncultured Pyrinomonadaceae bacterium]|uniref:NmrA-like domain-containing protein n=1 Tax=uncultured Pyrinomonadaceae bacterium TaxID=2283094 RepID=A0A6J4NCH2_9BACT|nr:MAG: hypothetical protein AVDCRST_MAG74-213 [uncultured Pyrinomonadaceae bacterium]